MNAATTVSSAPTVSLKSMSLLPLLVFTGHLVFLFGPKFGAVLKRVECGQTCNPSQFPGGRHASLQLHSGFFEHAQRNKVRPNF